MCVRGMVGRLVGRPRISAFLMGSLLICGCPTAGFLVAGFLIASLSRHGLLMRGFCTVMCWRVRLRFRRLWRVRKLTLEFKLVHQRLRNPSLNSVHCERICHKDYGPPKFQD